VRRRYYLAIELCYVITIYVKQLSSAVAGRDRNPSSARNPLIDIVVRSRGAEFVHSEAHQ